MVFRIYTEKKRGFDYENKNLLGYIKNYISVEPDTEIRLFDRYDFDGISKDEFDIISKKIIVDENLNNSFIDYLPLTADWNAFALSPIDGCFNEKLFNLKKTARAYGVVGKYKIKYAKVIAFSGLVSDYKLEEIKELLLDKKFNGIADNNKPLSIEFDPLDFGPTVVDEDFLEKNDIQIYQYLTKTSLKMSKEMLCLVRDYFKLLKRNPTLIELFIIDACLSKKNKIEDYKFSEINFENISGDSPLKITIEEFINMREQAGIDKTGAISLNDIAFAGYEYIKQRGQIQDVFAQNNEHLIQLPVDVNGVVEQFLVSFKARKSNKFNEIDIFPQKSLNSLEAYQSLCLDCRPYPDKNNTINSKSTFENTTIGDQITDKVAQMNRTLGICSSLGGQIFSKSTKSPNNYIATAFSSAKRDFSSKVLPGDYIIMLGSKMNINDLYDKNFYQRSMFSMREKINQFFKATENETYIKKSLDFSDGIVASLISEFNGVEIDINRIVASKYLAFSHLAVSVKNCRDAIVVSKENIEKVKAVCVKFGLSSHIIGEIKNEPYILIKNGKKQLANISTAFINSLNYNDKHSVLINDLSEKNISFKNKDYQDLSVKESFLTNLKDISVCSKKGISSKFDSTFGSGCVLAPYGGDNQITPSDAFVCKIPTKTGNTNTVTAISYGCNPKISQISPYHGAAFSIMEAISKIVATGANSINTKISICQNISDPKGFPSKYSNMFSALFGAFATEVDMNIPSISYDLSIDENDLELADFSCFSIAPLKANEVISQEFKSPDSTIVLVPMPLVQKTGLPDYDKAKVMYRQIHYLSQNGKVLSAGVVNDGGIAALVAKMSFGNSIGVDFETTDKEVLFSPKTASIVIETKNPGAFLGMDTIVIGKTIKEPQFILDNEVISLKEALSYYTGNLQSIYPTKIYKKIPMAKINSYAESKRIVCRNKVSMPKVVIPVFSSFSGASDSKRAFENVGGNAEVICINPKDYQNSINILSKIIDNSQIICLPSGENNDFSSEFGYAVMTNPLISEAAIKLLNRDGLIIGFEEGFDILLKTGLITSGVFKGLETGAYLANSTTGMPSSGFVRTKVISNKSPWLALSKVDEIYTAPVYHHKARFVIDEPTMLSLIKNNQIVTQYVDKNNKPTVKMPYNPDSSFCAVESICSPDGKIYGKISQPQRRTIGCFTNISGNKDQRIFEAGINYFKD